MGRWWGEGGGGGFNRETGEGINNAQQEKERLCWSDLLSDASNELRRPDLYFSVKCCT